MSKPFNVSATLSGLIMLGLLGRVGLLTGSMIGTAVLGMIPVALGIFMGGRLRRKAPGRGVSQPGPPLPNPHGPHSPSRRLKTGVESRSNGSDFTGGEVAQHGVQLIELQLLDVQVAEEIRGKGSQLLGCFHQPLENRIGIHLADSARGPNTQSLR